MAELQICSWLELSTLIAEWQRIATICPPDPSHFPYELAASAGLLIFVLHSKVIRYVTISCAMFTISYWKILMPWYDCFLIFDRSSWIRRAGGMLFSAIFAEVVFFFINVVLHFMGCIHLLATITHYLKFTIIGYISSKDDSSCS